VITKPDGTTITYYDCTPADGGNGIPLTVNQVGQWYIDWYGKTTAHNAVGFYAETPVFVLPESAIGALAAIGTGLVAFGIYSVVKTKRPTVAIHRSL
jgi:hypothetical protein